MIRPMGQVSIPTQTELSTLGNGKTISKMGQALKSGLMGRSTRASTRMELKLVREFSGFLMEAFIRDSF